ncbi:MAG: hypothetical protein WBP94_11715 [Rhodomicrobiaceae bacterium]
MLVVPLNLADIGDADGLHAAIEIVQLQIAFDRRRLVAARRRQDQGQERRGAKKRAKDPFRRLPCRLVIRCEDRRNLALWLRSRRNAVALEHQSIKNNRDKSWAH